MILRAWQNEHNNNIIIYGHTAYIAMVHNTDVETLIFRMKTVNNSDVTMQSRSDHPEFTLLELQNWSSMLKMWDMAFEFPYYGAKIRVPPLQEMIALKKKLLDGS